MILIAEGCRVDGPKSLSAVRQVPAAKARLPATEFLAEVDIPPTVAAAIAEFSHAVLAGCGRVAVRSSANAEDLGSASFAGRTVVDSAETLAERVVGVDPTRTEKMQRHRAEFVETFHKLAMSVEGGHAFDQDNIVKVFRKP